MVRLRVLLILAMIPFILSACAPSATCSDNYFEYATGQCCLDLDMNQICDEDEAEPVEPVPVAQPTTDDDLVLNELEIAAINLATYWENHDYEEMYQLFTEDVKALKSEEDFVYLLRQYEIIHEGSPSLRIDEINLLDDTNGIVFYHKSDISLFTFEYQSFPLKLVNGEWLFDEFDLLFKQECVYRTDKYIFSKCPITNDCSIECGKDYNTVGLPSCVADYEYDICECRCKNIKSVEDTCNKPVPAPSALERESKEELQEEQCEILADNLKILDVMVKDEGDSVRIKNSEDIQLTELYILIEEDYKITLEKLDPDESVIINKEEFLHKDTGKSFSTIETVRWAYVFALEGRYTSVSVDNDHIFRYTGLATYNITV